MRRMTLKEIQMVNLDIMKDIHSFCVDNNIKYSLAYGSLIGAIRHKGFIPWDDDIDIMMTRPNFERFSCMYKSQKGYILSSVYDNDTYVNYTRVYDNKTYVDCHAKSAKYDTGVWVDIYPIDGISDVEDESKSQFQRLRRYTSVVMKWRKYLHRLEKKGTFKKIKSLFFLCLIWLFNRGNFPFWHKQICQICKEQSFGTTRRCSSLVCMEANKNNKQEIFLTTDFTNYQLTPFEDQMFYIASGYDNILTIIFGDYMKIPPKDKQVSHLINRWGFYWVN